LSHPAIPNSKNSFLFAVGSNTQEPANAGELHGGEVHLKFQAYALPLPPPGGAVIPRSQAERNTQTNILYPQAIVPARLSAHPAENDSGILPLKRRPWRFKGSEFALCTNSANVWSFAVTDYDPLSNTT
jgi:hypothetical protein